MPKKLRTLKLTDGSVTSFRFDDFEWKAIDRAARARGYDWPDWARSLFDAEPTAPNRAALLRRAALEEAFGHALLAERAELIQEGRELDHPMLKGRFTPMLAGGVEAELAHMKITYNADMVAFEVIAGFHDDIPVVLIRSKLEDGLSCLISQEPIDDGPDLDLPDYDEDEIYNDLGKTTA